MLAEVTDCHRYQCLQRFLGLRQISIVHRYGSRCLRSMLYAVRASVDELWLFGYAPDMLANHREKRRNLMGQMHGFVMGCPDATACRIAVGNWTWCGTRLQIASCEVVNRKG